MKTTNPKIAKRNRRRIKIRSRISGTADVPRLCVFRSNRYVYAQLIDDDKSVTLASVTSLGATGKGMMVKAKAIGTELAKKAEALKISKVVFDRGGFIFTGKIKAVAEGAREGGLKF